MQPFVQQYGSNPVLWRIGVPRSAVHWACAETLGTTARAVRHGEWAVRVHDVAGNRDAVDVAQAWREGGIAGGQAPHG